MCSNTGRGEPAGSVIVPRALGAGQLCNVGTEAHAGNADVHEQDAELVADVDGQHVGERDRAHRCDPTDARSSVDIAAHGVHRRDRRQVIEHRELADITGVEDGIGCERAEMRGGGRMRRRMRRRRVVAARPAPCARGWHAIVVAWAA
jgi:hypothetical protein